MVDPKGVVGVKKLVHVFTFPYQQCSGDLKLCTMSFSFGDVYVVGTGGSNYQLWWIQEGLRAYIPVFKIPMGNLMHNNILAKP
jgi:hypothetical protein